MTALGTVNFMDNNIHLHIDENNETKKNVLQAEYHTEEEFKTIKYKNRETIPVFTDGSVRTMNTTKIKIKGHKEEKAGSAIFFEEGSPLNWCGATFGKPTAIDAELFAY